MLSVKTPVLFGFILIVFVIFSIKELTTTKKLTKYAKWSSCIQDGIGSWRGSDDDFWNHAENISSTCQTLLGLNIVKLGDSKLHVFPVFANSESVHLTVGVSGNIQAETQLKENSSQTLIIGASSNSKEDTFSFRNIGMLYPVAIGMDSGTTNVTIEEKGTDNETSIRAVQESVIQLDVVYFLKKVLKHDFYISIWFNTVFDELLDMLYLNGKFENHGITACQINLMINKKSTAKELLMNMISDRRYAVTVEQFDDYVNVYLINFDKTKCNKELILDESR